MSESGKKRLEWSPRARRDLFTAWEFVAESNLGAADKLAASIFSAADLLTEQPLIGRPGSVPNTREWIAGGTPFVIVYRVTASAIRIGRIIHARQKYPR